MASSRWVFGAVEALPMRQQHRAEGCGDQQRAGQFERPQVAGEDQRRKTFDVAAAVGFVQPGEAGDRDVADAADQQDAEGAPAAMAATRCPRMVSTSESAESTPISISTNRNSIITAPV